MTAAHISRTAPLCTDCAHFVELNRQQLCNHPSTPVNPCTGVPRFGIEVMRREARPAMVHADGMQLCGAEGALFASAHQLRDQRRLRQLGKQVQPLGVGHPGFLRRGRGVGTPVQVYALGRGVWTSREHGNLRVGEGVLEFDVKGDKIWVDPFGGDVAQGLVTAVEDLIAAVGCEVKAVGQDQFVELAHLHGGTPPKVVQTAILALPQGAGKTSIGRDLAGRLGCTHVVDFWEPTLPLLPGALHLCEPLERFE